MCLIRMSNVVNFSKVGYNEPSDIANIFAGLTRVRYSGVELYNNFNESSKKGTVFQRIKLTKCL